MSPRGRGGNKTTPKNPAPVSGPGALSARTDGGPGSSRQPIRPVPGGTYGDRQASIESQQVAPLPNVASSSGPPPLPAGPDGGQGPPMQPNDIFGPTARPGEPITTGSVAPDVAPDDPGAADLMLIAQRLPALEAYALRPGVSDAFKIMVKRLRSATPPMPFETNG